ncbi:MAG: polysaccharide deacetylase [Oscillospiraceae bacterium]|nr:polysaccharide deacetylase [Oscillospiraceae bacterium]
MYLGSVRFFKNLIFVAVCILILIPTLLAVKFHRQIEQLQAEPPVSEVTPDDAPELNSPDGTFEPDRRVPEQEPSDAEPSKDAEPISADPPSYQSLYPDFYAPQPYGATVRETKMIYLTFDDGPSDRTDEILAVLAEKNVKATFFVTGKSDEKDLERMKRIVDEGHTIGMHSYSHDYATVYASVESFMEEFYKNFTQIREATGMSPTVFRCPGGSINGYDGGFYQEILSEMIRRGFVPFDWNISSEDAVTTHIQPAAQLAANVVRGANGKIRGFVLFHDSEMKKTTPQAVGTTIDQLRNMGFDFAAITPSTLPVLYNYPN